MFSTPDRQRLNYFKSSLRRNTCCVCKQPKFKIQTLGFTADPILFLNKNLHLNILQAYNHYIFINIFVSLERSQLRPSIAATMALLLQHSHGARTTAQSKQFFIEILNELEAIHLQLDGVSCVEFLRRFGEAKVCLPMMCWS